METEKNKLIAEFMGVKDKAGWYNGIELHKAGLPFHYGSMGNGTNELKFHTSWDWLMPVVGKIKNVDVKFRCKHIGAFVSWEHRFKESLYVGIDNTYRDVVEFIKWYNENK